HLRLGQKVGNALRRVDRPALGRQPGHHGENGRPMSGKRRAMRIGVCMGRLRWTVNIGRKSSPTRRGTQAGHPFPSPHGPMHLMRQRQAGRRQIFQQRFFAH
ncbi:MAG: hypothetical protein MUE63_12645, partial [Xanthomonadales bacterium]|nr:hypothetical protein [Xanthomonadales bacterium]